MPKPPLNRKPWRTTDGKVIAAKGQPELNILIEEAELFKAADKLRGNMEPSDYKHVALGLIFLKHNSGYYDDGGGCYLVRRRVLTPYGWRIRRVQVCG